MWVVALVIGALVIVAFGVAVAVKDAKQAADKPAEPFSSEFSEDFE